MWSLQPKQLTEAVRSLAKLRPLLTDDAVANEFFVSAVSHFREKTAAFSTKELTLTLHAFVRIGILDRDMLVAGMSFNTSNNFL